MKTKNKMCGGLYTEKVMETFKNPHNYGKIKNADGIGKVGNIVCGDVMWLYIKVDKEEVIKDIKFETFGCVAAISTSSIITDLVKGKTIKEAVDKTYAAVKEISFEGMHYRRDIGKKALSFQSSAISSQLKADR